MHVISLTSQFSFENKKGKELKVANFRNWLFKYPFNTVMMKCLLNSKILKLLADSSTVGERSMSGLKVYELQSYFD